MERRSARRHGTATGEHQAAAVRCRRHDLRGGGGGGRPETSALMRALPRPGRPAPKPLGSCAVPLAIKRCERDAGADTGGCANKTQPTPPRLPNPPAVRKAAVEYCFLGGARHAHRKSERAAGRCRGHTQHFWLVVCLFPALPFGGGRCAKEHGQKCSSREQRSLWSHFS
ncbi:uncharacterized protein LOC127749098 isoform X1 [Frankliniella occidentalis]|uniref:Uncharacterized protein LOC127749098 isoform X1 n=1 Tax=Frankliniella occidentalis TaxID=133901 RepID=A0A9C6U2E9_FRAOC|nr:uncharacterized protein LOC127749098 isoform X1 [Frankliniella occidentalis]